MVFLEAFLGTFLGTFFGISQVLICPFSKKFFGLYLSD